MTIMQALVGGAIPSYAFNATISVNTINYNLKTAAIAAGWNQVLPLNATVTINSGVYVYSTSTGAYAFQTGSTFPAGTSLNLINNGVILGMGGAAANSSTGTSGLGGVVGGPALLAQQAITITNNGVIGGGGGGGGSGGGASG